MKDTTDHILPSSSLVLTTEEEAERFVIDSLRSQKEFDGFNLNQIHEIANAGRVKRNSGDLNVADGAKADGRFIFYFYTSTITSTKTLYTKSYTLKITACTPPA